MSDRTFRADEGETIDEWGNRPWVSRHPTTTDSLDATFSLLSDSRRRFLLYYLVSVEGDVVEFEAAVNRVCRYEAAGTEPANQSSREEIRTALHHTHLPRLANAGVLDYDHRQGIIRLTGGNGLEEWVEHARSTEME